MRKGAFLFFLLLVFAVAAQAQEYKKFKVGLGVGYAMASGKGAKGGILAYVEPAYRIQDNIALGFRWESAVIARGFSEDIGSASIDIAGIGSYSLNGQYYFNNNNFRPFAGLGLGLFSLAAAKVDADGGGSSVEVAAAASKFGFYPRIGFDAGHFSMSLDYNIIPATKVDGGGEFKNSYIGFRIGGFFGGGKQ